MPRLALLLAAATALLMLGPTPAALAQARVAGQIGTAQPTPLVPPPPTPYSGLSATSTPIGQPPGVPPIPRTTSITQPPRPNLVATATAAAATITVADATATANVAAPLTAVAQTATALAVPTRTATLPALAPTVAATLTPLATLTPIRTATPAPTVAAATPTAVPTPNALAESRTVLTRAPIAVGDETIAAGAALQIPLETALEDGAIPPGTPVRLPNGQVITLPAGTSIPAAENPTTIGAPLNAVLPRASLVGTTSYPQGTALVLPSGTSVLGSPDPNATVLLQPGAVVQVGGNTTTLVEPLPVVVSAVPVAQPAALPPTGDADPVVWPAGLGLLLVLGGWRLLRRA
ncbi:MAG TPA: hypothetical protein VK066_20255 [Chloroflexota bacterium]|nr:hypothetical protein [Chloroflexota bacterium]